MARPVTLFTGQWADLPLEDLAAKCGEWGFDGLELACWGDHFEVDRGAARRRLLRAGRRELLERHGLGCWAIGAHLVGQAVCDPIDERHQAILPPEVWGDGDPEGVRQRAAERMKDTARAAAAARRRRSSTASPARRSGTCSTRSRRTTSTRSSAATRSSPSAGARSSTSSRRRACASRSRCTRPRSPTTSSRRARRSTAIGDRARLRDQLRPEPLRAPVPRLGGLRRASSPTAIYHVHVKDSRRRLDGRSSILGGHLNFGEPGRGWDFVSPGHGDVDFEAMFRALNRIGYAGPLSIEWEDSGMDREWGAPGRARVRAAAPTSRPSERRVRRGDREGGVMSEVGFVTMGRRRRRRATCRAIGVGMLGYAFMGKAHSNAYRTLAYMTWPPPLDAAARRDRRPQRGGGRGGRAALRLRALRDGLARSSSPTTGDRAVRQQRARTTSTPSRRSPRPRRASTSSARSRSGRDADESLRDLAARRRDRRQAHVRLQLPLRAGRPARARDDRGGRARRDPPLPRRLPAGVGRRPRSTRGASTSRRPARARSATSARTSSTSPATSSARSTSVSATTRDVLAGPRGRRRRRGRRSRSRTAPSGRSRRRRFATGRKNALHAGRSTARRARSRSTSSASTSSRCTSPTRRPGARRRASAPCSSPRPTTRSGSTGGRTGHIIGWEHTFVHELHHLLTAIRDDSDVAPHGATFEDGYRAAEVCDAILRSASSGAREAVSYR